LTQITQIAGTQPLQRFISPSVDGGLLLIATSTLICVNLWLNLKIATKFALSKALRAMGVSALFHTLRAKPPQQYLMLFYQKTTLQLMSDFNAKWGCFEVEDMLASAAKKMIVVGIGFELIERTRREEGDGFDLPVIAQRF
jgi:hypothetical protein